MRPHAGEWFLRVTVGDALALGRERLLAFGDDGRFDALRLLEETLARSSAWILGHNEAALDGPSAANYALALSRRAKGEPVAYIVGNAGFYRRTFLVTPDVLVPRPETEQLVVLALAFFREHEQEHVPRICDVGTGSGILAITLACELELADVTAIDISPAALAVAGKNSCALGVAERVRLQRGDALDNLPPNTLFDCIVANLPYVRSGNLQPAPDATAFEPQVALDGGADGLDAYRRLLARARGVLAADGMLLMEAGPDTTQVLAQLAEGAFAPSARVVVHRDYALHERVVEVRV